MTVLEKEDRILPLFKYDPNRWLHPRVYDWPLSGWEQARAGLPVLDWTAGTVAEVRKQLEEGWRTAVAEAADRVRVTPSARVVMPGRSAESGVWLTWNAERREDSGQERFRIVVLAVGFGLENEHHRGRPCQEAPSARRHGPSSTQKVPLDEASPRSLMPIGIPLHDITMVA